MKPTKKRSGVQTIAHQRGKIERQRAHIASLKEELKRAKLAAKKRPEEARAWARALTEQRLKTIKARLILERKRLGLDAESIRLRVRDIEIAKAAIDEALEKLPPLD